MLYLHACVKGLGHCALRPNCWTPAQMLRIRDCGSADQAAVLMDGLDAAATRLCQAAGALWYPQGHEEQLWALRRHTLPSSQCRWT